MRFPRNTKIFRGQMDVAPFAGVLFLMVIFLLLNSSLVFVPGVPIQLPRAADLPGIDGPTLVVAVDESGQFYFDNQVIQEGRLADELRAAVTALESASMKKRPPADYREEAPQSVTLVVKADAEVKYRVLARLWLLAREAGITNMLQATSRPATPRAVPAKE